MYSLGSSFIIVFLALPVILVSSSDDKVPFSRFPNFFKKVKHPGSKPGVPTLAAKQEVAFWPTAATGHLIIPPGG